MFFSASMGAAALAVVGTRVPVEVRLILTANATVTKDAWLLGLLPGRKRLHVVLPLLAGLSADQPRTTFCYELGHYARRHTRSGAVVYRVRPR
jgi:Zn-dependent protease with chaperone function